MIRVRQIKVSINDNNSLAIEKALLKKLKTKKINSFKINKQ